MDFKGKVVVVTGGASGIGKAVVLRLAIHGANVVIVDLNRENANKVADEAKQFGVDLIVIKTDIAKFEETKNMARKVYEKFGKIDVLINNAGWDKMQPFLDNDPEDWYRLIDINLKGTIHVTRAVLEYMIKQELGSIVNVASDAARVGNIGEVVYSATKGGICSFTKSLAREMARHKIRVNTICPSTTDTPLVEEVKESMPHVIDAMRKRIPMKRFASPEEQANAIVWLASDEASYITGQSLSVNGGLNMC